MNDFHADLQVDYNINLTKKSFDYHSQVITLHEARKNKNLLTKLNKGDFFLVNESPNTFINGVYKSLSYKKIKRSDKGATHITLSHKEGYRSGDANTMFTNPKVKDKRLGYVEGTIKYFNYDKI